MRTRTSSARDENIDPDSDAIKIQQEQEAPPAKEPGHSNQGGPSSMTKLGNATTTKGRAIGKELRCVDSNPSEPHAAQSHLLRARADSVSASQDDMARRRESSVATKDGNKTKPQELKRKDNGVGNETGTYDTAPARKRAKTEQTQEDMSMKSTLKGATGQTNDYLEISSGDSSSEYCSDIEHDPALPKAAVIAPSTAPPKSTLGDTLFDLSTTGSGTESSQALMAKSAHSAGSKDLHRDQHESATSAFIVMRSPAPSTASLSKREATVRPQHSEAAGPPQLGFPPPSGPLNSGASSPTQRKKQEEVAASNTIKRKEPGRQPSSYGFNGPASEPRKLDRNSGSSFYDALAGFRAHSAQRRNNPAQ